MESLAMTRIKIALACFMTLAAQDICAQVPNVMEVPGELRVAMVHAEGAQVLRVQVG